MPTTSIDTFFACALVVSVALLATAFFVGTMQTRLNNLQDVNKETFLRAIAEHIVTNYGAPADWGSNGITVPSTFGLGRSDSINPYELDVDKVGRLCRLSNYSLSYVEVSKAARLNKIALGISISQLLSITVEPSANASSEDATAYTFRISVYSPSSPESANIRCYVVARDFVAYVSNVTSGNGIGYVTVQIPNSSNGPALLVVFARSLYDDRMTSYEVYSFAHLTEETPLNNLFLNLSPLNYSLNVDPKSADTVVENGYAFSYGYQSNLTLASHDRYLIPETLDKSPIVLVLCGVNGSMFFAEWVSYPQLPTLFGADFSNSEANVFTYTVTVKENLYQLILRFGDVNN